MVIRGNKVNLRPTRRSDFDLIHHWLNDPEVMTFWYGRDKPRSREWIEKHFPPAIKDLKNYSYWTIKLKNEPIGYASFSAEKNDDDEFMGIVEFDILIGDKSKWEKGYGTDALKAMLGYAFNNLSAERVFLIPRATNLRAIHVYEKVGFKKEGILRHNEKFEGKWSNGVMMSILREEFEK